MVICLEQGAKDLHTVQPMPLPPHHLLLLLQLLLLKPFYDPLSGTTQVSRYQKDKPFWTWLKQR